VHSCQSELVVSGRWFGRELSILGKLLPDFHTFCSPAHSVIPIWLHNYLLTPGARYQPLLRTTDLWWTKATRSVKNVFTHSTLGGLRRQEAFTLTEEPITRTTPFIFGKRRFSEDTKLCAPIQETISLQLTEKVWAQYIGRQTIGCEITSSRLHFTKAHMENDTDTGLVTCYGTAQGCRRRLFLK